MVSQKYLFERKRKLPKIFVILIGGERGDGGLKIKDVKGGDTFMLFHRNDHPNTKLTILV